MKKILISLVATFFFGIVGFICYLLSFNHPSNSPSHMIDLAIAYILIWPVLLIQMLGGENPVHYGTSWNPIKIISWLITVVYYYAVVSLIFNFTARRKLTKSQTRVPQK